ncbi:MAG: hypothetical protein N2508_02455 [Anaerolineae bacterium]|nr:hypothetical protein [Anaerolineae bacterium]
MKRLLCASVAWLQIGLAILPGLTMLVAHRDHARLLTALAALVPLAVSLLWKRELTPWSFPALGVAYFFLLPELFDLLFPPTRKYVAAHGWFVNGWFLAQAGACALLLVWLRRRMRWSRLGLALACLLLASIIASSGMAPLVIVLKLGMFGGALALGLLFAYRHRLLAGLLPVVGMLWWVQMVLDPGFSSGWDERIVFWTTLCFLVITPVWVLAARSTRGQLAGLLLPPAYALVRGVLYIPYSLSVWTAQGWGAAEVILVLAVAASLYRGFSDPVGRSPHVVSSGGTQCHWSKASV